MIDLVQVQKHAHSSYSTANMMQSRLDQYLICTPKVPSSGPTIFDLLYQIRCRIYTYAGLIQECPIELNYARTSDSEQRDSIQTDREHPDGKHLPSQLLYVSRAVSKEVSFLFYSRNRFTICRSKAGGLSAMHKLNPNTLASMTFLSVRLNASGSCSGKARCDCQCFDCHLLCNCAVGDQLLGRISRHDKSVISEWRTLCQRMASHVQPYRFKLCLICDTKDYTTAQDILTPLMAMPTLKECSIRVSHAPDRKLRRLTETTTLRLTGRASASPLTQFAVLPKELQLRILEHTDLVAPYDLEWNLESGYACESGVEDSNSCVICTQVLESCCTPLTSGAIASQCGCWRFPIALFSVSRTFWTEAMRIFYSRNHFSSLPYGGRVGRWPWPRRLDLSSFLTRLPLATLKHLRSLQFLFPDSGDFLQQHSKAAQDWTHTVDLLSRNADLPQLTLTIDVSGGRADFDSYVDFREVPAMERDRWAAYQRIVEPMVDRLRGLKNLFVHLSWPMYSRDATAVRQQNEQILEQRVKGEAYESLLRGKFSHPNRWTHDYGKDFERAKVSL